MPVRANGCPERERYPVGDSSAGMSAMYRTKRACHKNGLALVWPACPDRMVCMPVLPVRMCRIMREKGETVLPMQPYPGHDFEMTAE